MIFNDSKCHVKTLHDELQTSHVSRKMENDDDTLARICELEHKFHFCGASSLFPFRAGIFWKPRVVLVFHPIHNVGKIIDKGAIRF